MVINVGIDLGTTFSMVAHVNAYGQPTLFPDIHNANHFRTPSVVYIGKEGCLVGQAVEELLEDDSSLPTARFIKSLLTNKDYRYKDNQARGWSAEALSAVLLKKLIRDSTAFSGEDVGAAVITVPAHFTDEQRRATLAAASMAGLPAVQLVEEPVAAATYYGLDEGGNDRTMLVYDFGGGTFDVTVLQTSPEGLFVLATDGVSALGGRTIDEAIMDLVDKDFERRFGRSPLSDPGAAQRIRRIAEDAKIKLSRPGLGQVRQSVLLLGQPYEFVLTRAQYDAIALAAVEKTLLACERCLEAAALGWRDVDKILLTGGSSLLPQVNTSLLDRSGKKAADLVVKQPHQAVAFGAALLAERAGRREDSSLRLQQVTTADLSLRIWDPDRNAPALETLIPRHTPLPTSYSRIFYTARADQTNVTLEFVQRRGEPPQDFSLGDFSFGPILSPHTNYPVEVTVSCGVEGLVEVTAVDPNTGRSMDYSLHANPALGGPELEAQRRLVNSVQISSY